jgi:diacylglycerol kinase (ATP)
VAGGRERWIVPAAAERRGRGLKPLLIVNPNAGGGRAGRTFAAIRPIVERVLGPVDVELTRAPGHGITLARAAAEEGRELVISLGGDGTLHEVANGVLDAGDDSARDTEAKGGTQIGFIAQGTGGDFRKSFDLPHRLDRYLDAIASGREQRVDAARATFRGADGTEQTRWFVNILSAGLGGKVDRFVADARGALGPGAAYAWASLRAMVASEPAPIRCVVEHSGTRTERSLDAWAIAICNGGTFGSGMRVAPMAAVDDGRLEVVALSAPSKLELLLLARKLYAGEHLRDTGVVHLSGERVELTLAPGGRERVLLDVDGEALGELPLRVEIVPGALRMRV